MEYMISVTFDCINKKGLVSQKTGKTTVVTDKSIEYMMSDPDLLTALAEEMATVTKKGIISISINGIKQLQ